MRHSERRFALRARTHDKHETLDAAIGAFETIEAYRRYVAFLGRFRCTMERILNDVVWPADWSWRPMALFSSIEQDAADLNICLNPTHTPLVVFDNPSALLGALYVLEGSTLGAAVLKSRAALLGMSENFGARHLAVMTSDLSFWRLFLRQLDSVYDFDIDCAAQSANAVFDLALQCIETEEVALP